MAHFWQATFQHVLPLQFTMAGHPQDTELHATLVAEPMRLIVAQNGPKKRDSQPHADTYQSGRDNSPSRCDFHKIFWLYAVQLWTRCVEMPGHQDPRGP